MAELVDALGLGSSEFIRGGSSPFWSIIMSLLSQQDRKLVIKALEHYIASFKDIMSEEERIESNVLMNWIKLEYSKNEL